MYVANGNAGRLSLAGQGPDGCRRLVIDKKPISPVCMRARCPCITITSPARFTVQGFEWRHHHREIVLLRSFARKINGRRRRRRRRRAEPSRAGRPAGAY